MNMIFLHGVCEWHPFFPVVCDSPSQAPCFVSGATVVGLREVRALEGKLEFVSFVVIAHREESLRRS